MKIDHRVTGMATGTQSGRNRWVRWLLVLTVVATRGCDTFKGTDLSDRPWNAPTKEDVTSRWWPLPGTYDGGPGYHYK